MNKKRPAQVLWAKLVNNPEYKPYKDEYGTKHQPIWGIDYIGYNVVRNLPLDRGFVKGSQTVQHIMDYISRYIKFGLTDQLIAKYEGTVTVAEFEEKWNESIRLYSCS